MVEARHAMQDDALRCADGSSARAVDRQETHNADSQSTRGVRNHRPEGTHASPVDDVGVSGLLIAGCAVLVGQPGNAQSERFGDAGSSSPPRCSNRTLRGSYALNIDGTIFAGPNRLLLRGLAMRQFDGRGNLSQVDFTTINGAPAGTDWRSGLGTYEFNSDCTDDGDHPVMGARRSGSGWLSPIFLRSGFGSMPCSVL